MGTPVGGGERSLSVGWGGDIPVFPPIAILLAFVVGLFLMVIMGRNRFLPSPFKHLFMRVSKAHVCNSCLPYHLVSHSLSLLYPYSNPFRSVSFPGAIILHFGRCISVFSKFMQHYDGVKGHW